MTYTCIKVDMHERAMGDPMKDPWDPELFIEKTRNPKPLPFRHPAPRTCLHRLGYVLSHGFQICFTTKYYQVTSSKYMLSAPPPGFKQNKFVQDFVFIWTPDK